MKYILKKFLVYLILGCVILPILYFLIKNYDFNGNTINRIISNKYYLIFLFLSTITSLSLYGNENSKTKLILSLIICINCLYLFFLFFIGNIGLTQTQGLFILGFLILGFVSIYIKNWFGYIIMGLSVLGILIILFLGTIPLFDEGPDISGFENDFNTQLLIYSKINLNENHAQITKDDKIYKINQGVKNYDLKINNPTSQIIFKSDTRYENTLGFIIFKGGNFIEITPQSAILINKDYEIEILTGNIKYYPVNQKLFSFTGELTPILENDENIINILDSRYYENLKLYIKWSETDFIDNKTLLKLSQKTLNILSKIFPNKYEKNIKNLEKYLYIFDIDLNTSNYNPGEKTKYNIGDGLIKGFKKGLENID